LTLLVAITVALAALAVLAAIVIVAVGGGGELSAEHPDHPPLALPGRRAVGGTDAALLRLPLGLWGYHKQITDEALERFAYELTERDTRIAVLEQELAEARQGHGGAPHDRRRALPAAPAGPPALGQDPMATLTDRPPGPAHGTGGDPLATRTDAEPEPRDAPAGLGAPGEDDPASGHAYAPPAGPRHAAADRSDAVANDEAEEPDDVVDRPADREDDSR
jgi:hypothetical protein